MTNKHEVWLTRVLSTQRNDLVRPEYHDCEIQAARNNLHLRVQKQTLCRSPYFKKLLEKDSKVGDSIFSLCLLLNP